MPTARSRWMAIQAIPRFKHQVPGHFGIISLSARQVVEAKKSCGDRTVAASQAKNGWAWYDVATWEPSASQYLWIASGRFDKDRFKANPAVTALCVDQIEIVRGSAGEENQRRPDHE